MTRLVLVVGTKTAGLLRAPRALEGAPRSRGEVAGTLIGTVGSATDTSGRGARAPRTAGDALDAQRAALAATADTVEPSPRASRVGL